MRDPLLASSDDLVKIGNRQTLLDQYVELLIHFNKRINLISRNTTSEVWKSHIEHCLNLSKRSFPPGSRVVDWGTGGGLPGIPLAICFPEVQFIAVDSVGKKIQAVRAMVRKLGLLNLEAWQGRAEVWPGQLEYSVSRAAAPLADLWSWHRRAAVASTSYGEGDWSPGLICLKGGDLSQEIAELQNAFPETQVEQFPLEKILPTDVAEAKYIVKVIKCVRCDGFEKVVIP